MTMPDERTRATIHTRKFLSELLCGKAPKISELRQRARMLIRHYPTKGDLLRGANDAGVWDKQYLEKELVKDMQEWRRLR